MIRVLAELATIVGGTLSAFGFLYPKWRRARRARELGDLEETNRRLDRLIDSKRR